MANLNSSEKLLLESIFQMSNGLVLDFSNTTFQRFIYNECHIDIYSSKYELFGTSKANRLRTLWQLESDITVGLLTNQMLAHLQMANKIVGVELDNKQKIIFNDCLRIANRLRGAEDKVSYANESSINSFLKKKYERISLNTLDLDSTITMVLENRLSEIESNLKNNSPLSAIILCGSVLEGILLGIALKNMREFNQSESSPKDKETGKVLQFNQWTLSNLIDVAHSIGMLGLDIKKFSHSLRDFRNYIHPYEQMSRMFNPDLDTAKISWQVLLAAINDLNKVK